MKTIIAYGVAMISLIGIVMIISLFFIKLGWSLFMVPVFGLPELTWMQALGLTLLASAFRSSNTNVGNKK